jgi:hypothetical protein
MTDNLTWLAGIIDGATQGPYVATVIESDPSLAGDRSSIIRSPKHDTAWGFSFLLHGMNAHADATHIATLAPTISRALVDVAEAAAYARRTQSEDWIDDGPLRTLCRALDHLDSVLTEKRGAS